MESSPFGARLYRHLIRPMAFRMDPEKAHYRTMGLFGFGLSLPGLGRLLRHSLSSGAGAGDAVEVAGMHFPHLSLIHI